MTQQDDKSSTAPEPPGDDLAGRIQYGELSAHFAFQQQLTDLLDQADITEEQRQQFLIAASCPCCGAGGLSLSLSLKPDVPPRF